MYISKLMVQFLVEYEDANGKKFFKIYRFPEILESSKFRIFRTNRFPEITEFLNFQNFGLSEFFEYSDFFDFRFDLWWPTLTLADDYNEF